MNLKKIILPSATALTAIGASSLITQPPKDDKSHQALEQNSDTLISKKASNALAATGIGSLNYSTTKQLNTKDIPKEITDFTSFLSNLTIINSNGDTIPRFNRYTVNALTEIYKNYPQEVEGLVKLSIVDSNANSIPRFDGYSIKELVETYKNYPQEVENLAKLTTVDSDGNIMPRLADYSIKELAKTYNNYPNEVEKLLKMITVDLSGSTVPRFNEYDINNLAETYNKYLTEVEELVRFTIVDSNKNVMLRLDSYKIKDLAETYKKFPNEVKRLLQYTTIDFNGNIISRFQSFEINELVETYKNFPEEVEKLLEEKNVGTDGNTAPRFDVYDINNLAKTYNEYPAEVEKLMKFTVMGSDGNIVERFGAFEINTLAPIYKKYPNEVEKLLKFTYNDTSNNTIPRFNANEIKNLASIFRNYPNEIEDLAKLTRLTGLDSKGEIVPRFKDFEISSLIETYKKYSKEVEDLAKLTTSNPDGSITPRFNKDDIIELAPNKLSFELIDFIGSDSYKKELKQNSAGKYQNIVMDMFDVNNFSGKMIVSLANEGILKEDFLNAVKMMSKSTFKLAYDKPNQYLSGVDFKYSTPINGSLPELPPEELSRERRLVIDFFRENLGEISRALKYIDTDTISHMMDRRTDLFKAQLEALNKLTDENFTLLSEVLSCKSSAAGKLLSPKEKIQLCQIVEIFQEVDLDMLPLKEATQQGKVDINSLKQIIQDKVLETAGINPNDMSLTNNKKKFNTEYSYLVLKKKADNSEAIKDLTQQFYKQVTVLRDNPRKRADLIDLFEGQLNNPKYAPLITEKKRKIIIEIINLVKDIDKYSNQQIVDKMLESVFVTTNQYNRTDELYTCIRESVVGDFKKFITNLSNKYGQANLKTQQAFEQQGLNYDKWTSPEIDDIQLNVAGKNMSIKMWDRNPQEDLFMGNKTTCCTGIGTEVNAAATPVYLLNTSYNVVELYDSTGNVVGMSRVFMGNIENEPVLIMDNIELNKTFIKGMNESQLQQIRDGFFKYMNQYAEQVTGNKNAQVYFYSKDIHVPHKDLEHTKKVTNFIGALSQEMVYVNSSGLSWINPMRLNEIGKIDWLKVPKQ